MDGPAALVAATCKGMAIIVYAWTHRQRHHALTHTRTRTHALMYNYDYFEALDEET